MVYYLIEQPEHVQKITTLGVGFERFGTETNNNAVLLNEDQLATYLTTAGLDVVQRRNTDYDGVIKPYFTYIGLPSPQPEDEELEEDDEGYATANPFVTRLRQDDEQGTPTHQQHPRPRHDNNPTRSAYVSACGKRLGDESTALRGNHDRARRAVDVATQALVQARHDLKALEDKMAAIQQRVDWNDEQFGAEFDRMLAHPRIKDVQIDGNRLVVMTHTLCCRNPETQVLHEIGEFRIEIPLTGAAAQVKWNNLSRTVAGGSGSHDAPHIPKGSSPCYGNTGETFRSLLADFQYAEAAYLAIEFVESVNITDPWGRRLVNWPHASPELERQYTTT
jgi:hypothetical protein